MKNRDVRSEPFRILVTLGESNTEGACASEERFYWPNVLADLITEFQGKPVVLHNQGIGSNVISPRCPRYEDSVKPSALERYEKDVIALSPDLVVIAYGLNDLRGGTPVEVFREDLSTIVSEVKTRTGAIIILTTPYYITTYERYAPWNIGATDSHELYNRCIEQIAASQEVLFADIFAACKGADWVMHPDTVHNNDLGMRLVAHRIFETLARNCSCLSHLAQERSIRAFPHR